MSFETKKGLWPSSFLKTWKFNHFLCLILSSLRKMSKLYICEEKRGSFSIPGDSLTKLWNLPHFEFEKNSWPKLSLGWVCFYGFNLFRNFTAFDQNCCGQTSHGLVRRQLQLSFQIDFLCNRQIRKEIFFQKAFLLPLRLNWKSVFTFCLIGLPILYLVL